MGHGPFGLSAGWFLTLYIVLMIAAIVAGIRLPDRLRPAGWRHRLTSRDWSAYLAGGATRLAEAAVTGLLADGAMEIYKKRRMWVKDPKAGQTPVERSLLAISSPVSWYEVTEATKGHADDLDFELTRAGLLIEHVARIKFRFLQTLPSLLVAAFGSIGIAISSSSDPQLDFLVFLILLTLVFAACRFLIFDNRTQAGVAALQEARDRADRMGRSPLREEAGMAVALFGISLLAGSSLSDFYALRKSGGGNGGNGCGGGGCGDDGGSSGGDSGCGGGGCGGGGCGGGGCGS